MNNAMCAMWAMWAMCAMWGMMAKLAQVDRPSDDDLLGLHDRSSRRGAGGNPTVGAAPESDRSA